MLSAYGKFLQVSKIESKGLLNTTAAQNLFLGTVHSVGSEVKDVKKGAKVLFDFTKAKDFFLEGKQYYYVSFEGILAYENK